MDRYSVVMRNKDTKRRVTIRKQVTVNSNKHVRAKIHHPGHPEPSNNEGRLMDENQNFLTQRTRGKQKPGDQ